MLTLTYFDFDGSRGLECRLALHVAGIPFKDDRIKREQWPALKPQMPYGALPVLTDGHRKLAQSNAILRWIGMSNGLYPTDPWSIAEHDAVLQSVEDLRYKVPGSGLSDDEKKAAREAFAAGFLSRWAATVEGSIDGPFLDGDGITVTDIKVYVILRAYLGGVYDHIDPAMFDAYPALRGLYEAVDKHPKVRRFFASRAS